MSRVISRNLIKHFAGLELNDLLFNKIIPTELFDNTRITSSGTPIYDINGEVLYHRVPIRKGRNSIGYVDIAVNSQLGSPLLSVSFGYMWDDRLIVKEAVLAARKKKRSIKFNKVRFIAYSYPKIAIQFLRGSEEVLMLELNSWELVPKPKKRKSKEPPSNFERWSLIDELPQNKKRSNVTRFNKHLEQWDEICPPQKPPKKFKPEILQLKIFEEFIKDWKIIPRVRRRELHYSRERTDHHPCYELRGQLTGVWCVAASVQMLLDFYRYNYTQDRIARELNLGTRTNPRPLPYANDGDVVTVIENLTSNALDANMNTSPNWTEFISEINNNRPLISFIPGHSRIVAGYSSGLSVLGSNFRGLLVYDPWPPSTNGLPTSGGTITRWENFDTHTYRRTFTAQLTLV